MIGAVRLPAAFLSAALERLQRQTRGVFGVNFLMPFLDRECVEIAAAKARVEFTASLHRPAAELDRKGLDRAYAELEARCRAELTGGELRRVAECRYPGQGYEVAVSAGSDGPAVAAEFHRAHRARYGHADERRPVDVVNIRVIATGAAASVELVAPAGRTGKVARDRAPLDDLAPGTRLQGPLMLDGRDATARIEAGWRGVVHETGAVLLERE